MKKITTILSIITIIISCNKKDNENISKINENTENTSIHLVEMDSDNISKLLSSKNNDTIYVTNFFATWCGPCIREIPYFIEKMNESKNEKIKFTFINIDNPNDWATKVNDFAKHYQLYNNIVLLNYETMPKDFFSKNFDKWNGSAIPFTLITKGNIRDEHIGMMSKEELNNKINSLK